MANFSSIAAAGRSLERLLNDAFAEDPVPVTGSTTVARLVRTDDIDPNLTQELQPPLLTLLLYRVEVNRATRATWSAIGSHDGLGHLPLDLHYLLTPWAADVANEHRILGRAMQCLETTPILSGPLLDPSGAWATSDAVQVTPDDVPNEELARTFDVLRMNYRLSVPYLARVIRLDSRQPALAGRVATVVTGIQPGMTR